MTNQSQRPPTAFVFQDEYGGYGVSPPELHLDLQGGRQIRFRNLTNVEVTIDLSGPLNANPPRLPLKGGDQATSTVDTSTAGAYPYRVLAGGFEARGRSGPKVIVDP